MKISLASFCRLRPIFIIPVNFTSRNTCLCRRQQNMALKSADVQCSTNPDTFAKLDATQTTDLLTEIKVDPVRYMVWKKVQIEVNNKTKEKMKILNVSAAKEEFIKVVKEEIMEFKDHVERVKNQYNQVKRLKEILPNNNVLVQMDFVEDYNVNPRTKFNPRIGTPLKLPYIPP